MTVDKMPTNKMSTDEMLIHACCIKMPVDKWSENMFDGNIRKSV